jgi:hypothetical protein
VLARLLHEIRPGETLVVVRLDRLGRSVSHLLAVIEQLEAAGAHFRSLRNPINITTAHRGGLITESTSLTAAGRPGDILPSRVAWDLAGNARGLYQIPIQA